MSKRVEPKHDGAINVWIWVDEDGTEFESRTEPTQHLKRLMIERTKSFEYCATDNVQEFGRNFASTFVRVPPLGSGWEVYNKFPVTRTTWRRARR